jgi:hypothetical protein
MTQRNGWATWSTGRRAIDVTARSLRPESIDADIVGADRAAFEQLGNRHLRCR